MSDERRVVLMRDVRGTGLSLPRTDLTALNGRVHRLTASWSGGILTIDGTHPPFRAWGGGISAINLPVGGSPFQAAGGSAIVVQDRIEQRTIAVALSPDFIWWRIDEVGTCPGSLRDYGPNQYHATLKGSWLLTDEGLDISGAGWAESPVLPTSFRSGDITISAWVKVRNRGNLVPGGYTPQSYPPAIVSNDVPGQGGNGIGASIWNDGGVKAEFVDGRGFNRMTPGPDENTWLHVAMTVDVDGLFIFWVNGAPRLTQPGSPASAVANSIKVGRHNFDGGSYPGDKALFYGVIKDVRIWQRALPESDIIALYQAGRWGGQQATVWCAETGLNETSYPAGYFAGGASLPAGVYEIEYGAGAIDYDGASNGESYWIRWPDGAAWNPGILGPYLWHSGGSSWRKAPGLEGSWSTVAAAEAANAGQRYRFLHAGGSIFVRLEDFFGNSAAAADNTGKRFRYILRPSPAPPVIDANLAAAAVVGTPFSYAIPVDLAASVTLAGLPAWATFTPATNTITGTPTVEAVHAIGVTAVNPHGSSLSSLAITVTSDWPPGGALPTGWVNGASADAGWSVTSGGNPGNCLTSDDIGDGQVAAIEASVTTGAGNVTFDRKVSSESGYDFLRFRIDGVQQGQWSGTVAWGTVSFPVTAGTHTFRWEYSKDVSLSSGTDSASIDNVSFP